MSHVTVKMRKHKRFSVVRCIHEIRARGQSLADMKSSRRAFDNRLHFYHELDPWQQDNHFIRSGYVKETSSSARCLKSLFFLHNETVNVYSHLIPSLAFLKMIYDFMSHIDSVNSSWVSTFVFSQFAFGATACFGFSSSFHLFKSHSWGVCRLGNRCDYFGIILMITSSLISIIVFAFDDHVFWRNGFIIMFLVFATCCTKMTFDPKFSTPHYRPIRSLMFIFYGLSGALPILASILLYGYPETSKRSGAHWLVMEGVLYISGACLYAARIPERWVYSHGESHKFKAGMFDLFGHLHQIFHIMVVVAALCHWRALRSCHEYWVIRWHQTQLT